MLEFVLFVLVFTLVPLTVGMLFVFWGVWDTNRYLLGESRKEQVQVMLDLAMQDGRRIGSFAAHFCRPIDLVYDDDHEDGFYEEGFWPSMDQRPPLWKLAEVLRPTPGCFVPLQGAVVEVQWDGLQEASKGLVVASKECTGERYPCLILNRGLDHVAFSTGHTMACTKPGEEW